MSSSSDMSSELQRNMESTTELALGCPWKSSSLGRQLREQRDNYNTKKDCWWRHAETPAAENPRWLEAQVEPYFEGKQRPKGTGKMLAAGPQRHFDKTTADGMR